ncbi:ABC transporter permease subunit [Thermococcus nautili]|uniref:ABC-type transport system involved in multi-copper enzyme maturation, permease component n=1 Tax=Thermococcus nautili TaxID=195522 RepID=W8NS68_9EURY|nr:ABC transporter permease subunit [Thermococcus nautili]AHL21947.1 ABC-type transport system involved in multi-copper enzyme maturation, permease component [Thermococcus nautili]NJE48810.1 ABC transporter permease [Thermococcus sp. 9N3]CAI1494013.1 ABC-type transport system involved in multi-copper enzyme maturation, permease component [Thermococcus nautili]
MFWGFQLEFMKGMRTKKLWAIMAIIIALYIPAFYYMKQEGITNELEAIAAIITFSSKTALFFLGILAIVFGAGAINKEIEDGTIRIALSKSVTRLGYILGKYVGQLVVFGVALLLTSFVTLAGLQWVGVSISKITSDVFLLNLLLLLTMLEFIAIGYIISTFVRSSGTSLGVALGVFFLLYIFLPAFVMYKAGEHAPENSSMQELLDYKADYYTKYLFYSPSSQFSVILDAVNDYKEVTKTVEINGETHTYTDYKVEYAGIDQAMKKRAVNVALLVVMTLVYLGIATWRFLRMDMR